MDIRERLAKDQRLSETQLNMTLWGLTLLLIRTKFRSGRAKTLSVPSSSSSCSSTSQLHTAFQCVSEPTLAPASSPRREAHLRVRNCMSLGGVGGGFHVFCCQCFERRGGLVCEKKANPFIFVSESVTEKKKKLGGEGVCIMKGVT